MTAEEVFERIYRRKSWNDPESASGKGSNLAATETLRSELPALLRRYKVRSLLDIPCGDFHWMQHVDLAGIDYIGADIVPDIIDKNRKYERSGRSFRVLDLIRSPLPEVDVVFTRDCLVHLSTDAALQAIANIRRSGARYLLATTFPESGTNEDILTGEWRALDLRKAPFSFPKPLAMIAERPQAVKVAHRDKSMGLWEIGSLTDES